MAGGERIDDWKGIYCLEGDRLGQTTVEPVLGLLEAVRDLGVRCLHHDVATRGELEFRLRQWAQPEFARHPILYLAFDGRPGEIELAPGAGIFGLRELAALLEGACEGRVIHFGSCATLDLHGNTLNRFMRRTGALALFSYRSDVDRLLSCAFDLLLLEALQRVPFTARGMQQLERLLKETALRLGSTLAFRIDYDRARARRER